MKERTTLVLASAIAAWCVANAAVVFAKVARMVRPGDLEFSVAQIRIALPAMLAVAASAWWCTRKPCFKKDQQLLMAGFITLLSYPFLSVTVFLVGMTEVLIDGSLASHGFLENVFYGMVAAGAVAIIGLVVTALPAFVAEYAVVRLVCSPWMRATLPGVDP